MASSPPPSSFSLQEADQTDEDSSVESPPASSGSAKTTLATEETQDKTDSETSDNEGYDETDKDGLPRQERKREGEPPHDKLTRLFAIYSAPFAMPQSARRLLGSAARARMQSCISKYSKDRHCALGELRVHICNYWDEIVSTQSIEFKKGFLDGLLKAITTEKDAMLREILTQVAGEVARKSIDNGVQTWIGIMDFIKNSHSTGSISIEGALTIFSNAPNLFGKDVESPLCFLKRSMENTNTAIQTAAMRCLYFFLGRKELLDLSPLIPILIQKAEERFIDPKSGMFSLLYDQFLIANLSRSVREFPHSFPLRSIISIVSKVLQSYTSQHNKEVLMPSLVARINHDKYAWTEIDQESRANIITILHCCQYSYSSKLNEYGLQINRDVLKSKRVIITDFNSTDFTDEDTNCGMFTEERETNQKRVQQWNCCCDLLRALSQIEGSCEPGGIALAIINAHGIMFGDMQYLKISDKSTCERCVSPIPLSKVMAALHSAKKNTMCAVIACRVREESGSWEDSSSSPSSLTTRYVSLLMSCSAGGAQKGGSHTRKLLLDTLYVYESVKEAMAFLHGKFTYAGGEKVNDTPIEVIMHEDWLRHETNDDGLTPQKRERMEELPHEKLTALFTTYKTNSSHEDRYNALNEIRFHISIFWDDIVSTQSIEFKKGFLDDLLEAFTIETDDKLMKKLFQVFVEAAQCAIDRTTGFQTWNGVVRVMEMSLSGSFSLKMTAISILTEAPNLFGKDVKWPLCFLKSTLEDNNMDIQSAAIKCLATFLSKLWGIIEQNSVELSSLIPIIIQRAEERLIVSENDNDNYLFVSLAILSYLVPDLIPRRSMISIVNKVLHSSAIMELKEMLMSSLKNLWNHDNDDVDDVDKGKVYVESMTNIVAILPYYASSENNDLKMWAINFCGLYSLHLSANPTALAEFFKKLLEDTDEEIRGYAFNLYADTIRVHKNDPKMQSALIPLIPTVIKLAEKIDWTRGITAWRYFPILFNHFFPANFKECSAILGKDGLSVLYKLLTQVINGIAIEERGESWNSLLDLIEPHPAMNPQEHIGAAVNFCMDFEFGSEYFLTTLKEPNGFQTAMSSTHSFMQNGEWIVRYHGVNGFAVIAKEGYGSMKEHMDKMTPLLKDPNARVRSLVCVALGEIMYHSLSKKEIHEMIILALISAVNDDSSKVCTHAVDVLIDICPKEILISHLRPLIDAMQNKIAQMEKDDRKIVDNFKCLERIFELLFATIKAAEKAIAPYYSYIINLIKNWLEKKIFSTDQARHHVFNCISLLGSAVDKEMFIKDVDEILRLPYVRYAHNGIARWCEIIGSDFSPLLPLVIDDIVKKASQGPLKKCRCGRGFNGIPHSRSVADAALVTIAKTLGELFAPHVDKVFKAVQQHLKYPMYDKEFWAGEIFPLLLSSLVVEAKRELWVQFWPEFKEAVKIMNKNKYSAMAIYSIAKSIEKLRSEGITKEESEEIGKWIADELDAVEKRRLEREEENDEDSKIGSDEKKELIGRDEEWKKHEDGVFEALEELKKIGGTILGLSFSTISLPQSELIEDDGVKENIQFAQEDSNNNSLTS